MLKEDGNQRCQTEIQFQFRIIQKFLRENGYSLDLPRGNSDDALGFGTFSKVYRGKRIKKNCKKCAIKVIDRAKLAANMKNKFLPRELSVLEEIKHSNIIRLHDILKYDKHQIDKVFIITDLAEGGDLLDYIMSYKRIRESRAKKLFSDLARAVSYLHSKSISHRDIKGENILLKVGSTGKPEKVLLTDFGFARKMETESERSLTYCGSTAYVPPEILENNPYRPMRADCWSMGVILYIMLCAFMPFDTNDVRHMIKRQKSELEFYHMSNKLSTEAEALICGLMNPDTELRLSALAVLESSWIRPENQEPRSILGGLL
jgi:serine kinase